MEFKKEKLQKEFEVIANALEHASNLIQKFGEDYDLDGDNDNFEKLEEFCEKDGDLLLLDRRIQDALAKINNEE